jgi:hypothetical protein
MIVTPGGYGGAVIVLSNRALGPRAELMVSDAALQDMLRAVARAAAAHATARWEHELVRWLDDRAEATDAVDVGDIAWTPEHFESQRAFVVDAIVRAGEKSLHAAALSRWARMIDGHPREAVVCGRRWRWTDTQPVITTT